MAHFAELNSNNKVIRVVTACNQDIANNGGELSEQAAQHFATILPLSSEGVKWMQTSYHSNFRKKYASIGDTYDSNKDKFISPQPYPSWTLNANDDWKAPIEFPSNLTYGDGAYFLNIEWDEENKRWTAKDVSSNLFYWEPSLSSWISIIN